LGRCSHTIYFIRHGETDWNAQGRLQGRQETDLNARGRVQAVLAAQALRDQVADPSRLDFVSSPMVRTRQTMNILRETLGLPVPGYRLDERLREIGFGLWEGLSWKDIRRTAPADYARRERDRWTYVPAGGESYADVAMRLAGVLDDLQRDTVIVSHGGVARTLLTLAGSVAPADAVRLDIWQGRLLLIRDGGYEWSQTLAEVEA
jgi:probable phosphoglycerate mutase